MKLLNDVSIEVKKSKLIGYYYQVESLEEVNTILANLRKEHKKARHLPYAYIVGNQIKKSDDKEPSGTAGMPILNILEKNHLDSSLIVIVRYFGGIKLGAGGLIRAYSNTAKEVIKIN